MFTGKPTYSQELLNSPEIIMKEKVRVSEQLGDLKTKLDVIDDEEMNGWLKVIVVVIIISIMLIIFTLFISEKEEIDAKKEEDLRANET